MAAGGLLQAGRDRRGQHVFSILPAGSMDAAPEAPEAPERSEPGVLLTQS